MVMDPVKCEAFLTFQIFVYYVAMNTVDRKETIFTEILWKQFSSQTVPFIFMSSRSFVTRPTFNKKLWLGIADAKLQ